MNSPNNLHGPLRRELIAVLNYVNRGAGQRTCVDNSFSATELHLDRLVRASRMQ